MSQLIEATFIDQFTASAAMEKLLSQGVAREQVVLRANSSVGNSGASSSATTNVVSEVSHRGQRTDKADHRNETTAIRSPLQSVEPAELGYTQLTVWPASEQHGEQLVVLLKQAGASSVTQREGEAPHDDPRVHPANGEASADDVERAVNASRGGATLKP